MARFGLSSPWVIFYNEINALFKDDPDIRIVYKEDEQEINLYVNIPTKAAALSELLPVEKVFGAVTVKVNVIPANKEATINCRTQLLNSEAGSLYRNALRANPHFEDVAEVTGVFDNPLTYVIFKKEVIQYFNDSLGDINGVCSTLAQNIAEDIFIYKNGVFFCTDVNSPEEIAARW